MASSLDGNAEPADVVRELLRRFERADMAGFVELFADDVQVEIPLAAPGAVNRLNGRDAVWEYVKNYSDRFDVRELPHIHIHETTEPGVVIVEWTAHGTTVSTGRPYEMRYIIVIEVRDGRVVLYRDYFSPIQAAKAGHSRPDILALYPDEDGAEAGSS